VNLNPLFFSASYAAGSFCCLYEVDDSSLLGSSIIAIGIFLSPTTLPCSSVSDPGRISIEWDVLRREIFPRGKALVQNQKQNAHRV
jgi:hypothetical protein